MGNRQVQAVLEVGYATAVGSRDNQEDSLGFRQYDDGSVLAVLADGMGGHAGGDVASELAVRWFGDYFPQTSGSIATRLEETLQYTQRQLCRHAEGKPALQGMGSTLIAVFVHNQQVHWVSVGDSLLYRVGQGCLDKLNAEHNVQARFRRLWESGKISPEELAQVQNPHALTSALGPNKLHEVDSNHTDLPQDAVLILASDGLLTLEQADISGLLTVQATAQTLADRLLQATLAQHAQGQDNIGVVVIKPQTPVTVPAGRPRWWVGLLGMVLVLGASAGLLYQLYQAEQQTRQAQQAREKAEQMAQQAQQAQVLAEQQAKDAQQEAEKTAQEKAEETRRANKAEKQKQEAQRRADRAEKKAREEAEAKAKQEAAAKPAPQTPLPPTPSVTPPPQPQKDVVPELDKNTVLP